MLAAAVPQWKCSPILYLVRNVKNLVIIYKELILSSISSIKVNLGLFCFHVAQHKNVIKWNTWDDLTMTMPIYTGSTFCC